MKFKLECVLLNCCDVWSCGCIQSFPRNMLPPSSTTNLETACVDIQPQECTAQQSRTTQFSFTLQLKLQTLQI
jgi:hypothetical protein